MIANRAFEDREGQHLLRSVRLAMALFAAIAGAFVLCSAAAAAKLEVLHEFTGPDGSDPQGGLTLDPNTGKLYGTAIYGGAGNGTVFSLSPPATGERKWKFKVIYTFQGDKNGSQPMTGLAISPDGKTLWGTTRFGSLNCACATIFRLHETSQHGWEKETFHDFSGETYDGTIPNSTPVLDPQATHLYGTTGSIGGSTGTIYSMKTNDGSVTVLYNPAQGIGDPVGTRPFGVVVDIDANLYGTALDGAYEGTLFQLNRRGKGKILYGFNGPPDGAYPGAPPIMDSSGTLYGSTLAGGDPNACPQSPGCGTIWRKRRSSGEEVLHSMAFFSDHRDGHSPISPLVLDAATGTLYGTTFYGGTGTTCGGDFGSCGTIFSVDGNGKYKTLWEFPRGGPASPQGQLVFDDGVLYGSSYDGGTLCPDHNYIGCGTVWKLTP